MNSGTIIGKAYMFCPLCGKTHEVEERSHISEVLIKDETVSYEERFFYCSNAEEDENEFESGALASENHMRARNAYRVKKGLLTSDEIVAIRESYGLSQVDLARLLGWGEATIARYESKAIQDDAYDTMLRFIKDNPLQALDLLNKNASKFSDTKLREVREKIVEKIDSYGKEYLTRRAFEAEYACFEEPSESNGRTTLNIDKLEAAVSYMAEKVANLFKVKLMKMLWYADALSYKTNGSAITGLVYRHHEMGALPIGHYSLMNLERLNVQEEQSLNYGSMLHVYPAEEIDYSVLSSKDKKILDAVIKKFQNFSAQEIVDYMHGEKAYLKTGPGEIIPFEYANELRDF